MKTVVGNEQDVRFYEQYGFAVRAVVWLKSCGDQSLLTKEKSRLEKIPSQKGLQELLGDWLLCCISKNF